MRLTMKCLIKNFLFPKMYEIVFVYVSKDIYNSQICLSLALSLSLTLPVTKANPSH